MDIMAQTIIQIIVNWRIEWIVLIHQIIAEEAGEVLIASKNDENLVYESVDLIFHTLLLLVYKGIEIDEIFDEFSRRRK